MPAANKPIITTPAGDVGDATTGICAGGSPCAVRLICWLPPFDVITNWQLNDPVPGGEKNTISGACPFGGRLKLVGMTLKPSHGVAAVPVSVPPPTFCTVYVNLP